MVDAGNSVTSFADSVSARYMIKKTIHYLRSVGEEVRRAEYCVVHIVSYADACARFRHKTMVNVRRGFASRGLV